ncbi:DUF1311 domain-containing protein [Dyella dinghuensis]|uniref:DUF1311 domain-containing protein n=1 Tax=Dyella dinghuensis TaxID=1920169 RepID=A0A3S0PHV1_9GAMM|nr:lysozyme inhibitor LprI family protein [Dyella dinghuensis]RUL67092.1 DUF1311 domain-containing protein [Dyella dinghuensis]
MTEKFKIKSALTLVAVLANSYAVGLPVFRIQDGAQNNPYSKSRSAQTETQKYRESYYDCVAASGGVTANILDCSSDEASFQDSRRNAAYKKLQTQLSSDDQLKLHDEERAWISARDKDCNALIAGGGTADSINQEECVLSHTADRANELQLRLNALARQ